MRRISFLLKKKSRYFATVTSNVNEEKCSSIWSKLKILIELRLSSNIDQTSSWMDERRTGRIPETSWWLSGTIFIPFHLIINKFFVLMLKYGHCPVLWTFPNIYPVHHQLVLMQFPEEISVVTETGRHALVSNEKKKTFN